MAPYIAALIILIVAILFMVFKRVDTFEVNNTSLKGTDTLQTAIAATQTLINDNAEIIKMLDSMPEIKEETSQAKLDEIMIPYSKVDGKVKVSGPSVTAVLKESSYGLEKEMKPFVEIAIKLNPSMKLNELIAKPEELQNFASGIEILKILIKNRKAYLKSKMGSSSASTTVSGVNSEDLYDAVSGSGAAVKASTLEETPVDVTKSKEQPDSARGMAPSQSSAATKEMEDRIAKSVATQIKDTLLSHRSTSNGMEDSNCPYAPYDSNSTAQGREYTQVKPIQPAPDMSEYIRKDSIPCWNCTLP